ncbi:AMP phosphorylase [Candidatus Bathyarchaeota archaeon]|nr:MAG: AMP phosphorylase [Candidatus Bathyarchaeota archaeon]
MEFKARLLEIEAGGNLIVIIGARDAERLGVISSDRVRLETAGSEVVAILNIASEFPQGVLGIYEEVRQRLGLREEDTVQVRPAERPESLRFIREKIMGGKLTARKMELIVEDVVERHLSDIELAAFVTALQVHGLSMEEAESLSRAMVKAGRTIGFNRTPILDKHSIGGVPGDKTTLLVVPIIAAAGYTIPKSSSRAITSPAGTADRMEALCPVDLRIEEIIEVVEKVNACVVWGGALDLAPADDLFIRVEYPLSIDPLLLPSIMSKKKAMGSSHIVVDIPTGRGAKINTLDQAQQLARNFIELGARLDMHVECARAEGEQPIGWAIGPNLEAREALETLMGGGPPDLIDKATSLAGILLEMVGEENGKERALELLSSGKAEEKLRQIIEAQGGDPEVKPEDLAVGDRWIDVRAERSGRVLWINNRAIAQIARTAGTPSDKGAGLLLRAKMGDEVSEGDVLFRIYAESAQRLDRAAAQAEELAPVAVGSRFGERMLIKQVRGALQKGPAFILER